MRHGPISLVSAYYVDVAAHLRNIESDAQGWERRRPACIAPRVQTFFTKLTVLSEN
jgi:hypothetical protein